jgi:glutamate dehydrogenase
MEEVEAHLCPRRDHRIIDIDYCNNASAIHHLEPVDDIVIREWGKDGELVEATLLVGRLAKGAFTQKAADIPLLKEKQDAILAQSGAQPKSYAYREIRALFNRFPTRELFYANVQSLKEILDLIVYMTSDDEIAVHSRNGSGYVALDVAFSRLRYSYTVRPASGRPWPRSSAPSPSGRRRTWGRCRSPLLLRLGRDESPSTSERC